MAPDYYAILGVPRDAASEDIKRAYRRLTRQYHPDRHPGDASVQERFRLINEAYNVLGDTTARLRYDAGLRLADTGIDITRGFDGAAARDVLENVFGNVFGARRRENRRGRDLRYTLTVSLEEAALGSSHTIRFEALGPCETCKGSGHPADGRPPQSCSICEGRGEVRGRGLLSRRTECGRCDGTGMIQPDPCQACRGRGTKRHPREFSVRLPPGSEHGAERVLAGQGEPGRFGGAWGDLRVTVNVRPHAFLTRSGTEIRCEVPISVTEAALGTRVEVPTLEGPVMVDVPRGIRSGTKLRLRKKGVPTSDRGRGDQLVSIAIETPAVFEGSPVEAALHELERVCSEHNGLPYRTRYRGTK